MDRLYYEEMVSNLDKLADAHMLQNKTIYLFGHCNATEELANLLIEREHTVNAILDNNVSKHGIRYRGIPIVPPEDIMNEQSGNALVCIAARAYEAMKAQLRKFGFSGEIARLVDYNSFSEYSLTEDTLKRKQERVRTGLLVKDSLERKYPGCFKILCPFSALGDIFFAMSYLPYFLEKRNVEKCVIGVIGKACAQVAELFQADASDGQEMHIEIFSQKDMDELTQACLYTQDSSSFIAHQDRPYVVNLHNALYIKCIPLEQVYCCGVFGLPMDTNPVRPRQERLRQYPKLQDIRKGKAVIFSPYAKSVTALPEEIWQGIVQYYKGMGYQCFTNAIGNEQALAGTIKISPAICELQSVVEHAGTFIGIRSGLCDVLKYAECEKTALYPDYNYCDTKWKAIDMYALDGWKNIVVQAGFRWEDMIWRN